MFAVAIVSESTNPSAISVYMSPLALGTYLCAIPLSVCVLQYFHSVMHCYYAGSLLVWP